MDMQGIDIALLIILIIAFIKGLRDGFILQAFSVLGLLAAMILGISLAPVLINFIPVKPEGGAFIAMWIVAWIVTSSIVLLLFSMLSKILSSTVNSTPLGFINKILGSLFSIVATGLILSFLIGLYEMGRSKFGLPDLYNPEQETLLYDVIREFSVFRLTS